MIKNKDNNKNEGLGCCIALLILIAIILVPIIIGLISNSIKRSNEAIHEERLIEEGKIISADTIIDEVIEILKNRDEEKLKQYLTNDFSYCNNNNNESKFTSGFWTDLKYYTGKHYIELRGDSTNQDNKTFWIYWDIPENITEKQYSEYSLQRIFVYMEKVIKEDTITYQINKIILRNN